MSSAAELPGRRVEYMPIAEILRAPRNPKRHADGIGVSIARFGLADLPVLDERTGRLVSGHGRLDHLQARQEAGDQPPDGVRIGEHGEWLLPVVRGWASRSDTDADAYVLAANQLTIAGGWDDDQLGQMLADLAEADAELFAATGFTDEDLSAFLSTGDSALGGDGGQGQPSPTLADRFLIPPLDVLDARQGWWRERKRQWLGLGIQSEIGRGHNLAFADITSADPGYYTKKTAAERLAGRPLSHEEFQAAEYGADELTGVNTGTSVFDPVLCELVLRWFSAPDAAVLDPFAGGSVRGIVTAALGRRYHGVDLRADQVEANRAQAMTILSGATHQPTGAALESVDDPRTLTPVECHGGILVKRDDVFSIGGSRGGKVRSALALITAPGVRGVITAGARHSPQVNIVATIASAVGLPCRVHVPSGALTPELRAAQACGAEVVQHAPGRNNVIIARARDDAAERGWLEVPFGMECPEAVRQTRAQVVNIPADKVDRVVVPVGSGMSLAGVLHGLDDIGRPELPVVGIVVGADPTPRLDRYAPPDWRDRCTLIPSGMPYARHADAVHLGDLALDPIYEAKCLPHLTDGDLLWVVGRRETADGAQVAISPIAPPPTWTPGDAAKVLPGLPSESVDLVFTCPPYYDLERYSDDPADLSTLDHAAFDVQYAAILSDAVRILRRDRFAVIVTGDARDPKGVLHDLRGATIRAMEAAGATLVSAATLVTPVGSVRIFAARQFVATRTLARTHQDVLIFVKGDRGRAAKWCGDVDLHFPTELTDGEPADIGTG